MYRYDKDQLDDDLFYAQPSCGGGISKLSRENQNTFKNGYRCHWQGYQFIIPLNSCSVEFAILLNEIFENKRIMYSKSIVNGGFLIENKAKVIIKTDKEVGVALNLYKNTQNRKFLFQDQIITNPDNDLKLERISALKEVTLKRIASTIKEQLKRDVYQNKFKIEYNEKEYSFEKEDILIAQKFFEGKLKTKDLSPEKKLKLFGEKVQNQFVISAVDTLHEEIRKTRDERNKVADEIDKFYATLREKLQIRWRNEIANSNDTYNKKIEKLKDEINALMDENEFTF